MLQKLGHILILLGCFLQVNAQANFLQSLDQESIPDSSKINQINDYAWQLFRKQPDSADFLAREAIKRAVGADSFPKGLVNAHIVLGILNKDRGFFESSVEHYLQALPIAEASGDFLRVSTCLNNLGSV